MSKNIEWPLETAKQTDDLNQWCHADSNICLDFHGDPARAGLAVFSDGNHHMALEACLKKFCSSTEDLDDVFYATTPPAVIVNYLKKGYVVLGNLTLSRSPDVFISPLEIMEKLLNEDLISSHKKFMESKGNVLLVRKGNPKNIQTIEDLLGKDVRLFISNPVTEKASHEVYKETLLRFAAEYSIDAIFEKLEKNVVYGERIHHREAPQCLYNGGADVAIIYYHLALRYARIFSDEFEIVFLEGSQHDFDSSEENVGTEYHIALTNGGGEWGEAFFDFMFTDVVADIYTEHGLQRP